jgi:hypothetical protein
MEIFCNPYLRPSGRLLGARRGFGLGRSSENQCKIKFDNECNLLITYVNKLFVDRDRIPR